MILDTSTYRDAETWVQTVDDLPNVADSIIDDVERQFTELRSDPRWTAEGRREREQEIRDAARERLGSAFGSVEAAAAAARRRLETLLAEPATTTADATLREMREQAAWARLRPLLEAGLSPHDVLERVGADLDSLRALKRELPSWLLTTAATASRGVSAFLEDFSSTDDAARTLVARIEDREASALGPEYERAHRLRRRLDVVEPLAAKHRDLTLAYLGGYPVNRMSLAFEEHFLREGAGLPRRARPTQAASRDQLQRGAGGDR